jgi:hypothetical protein
MYDKHLEHMPLGMVGVWMKLGCRFLQFVLGVTIFGIYCADMVAASSHNAIPNGAWLLATTVGGLSAVTAIIFCIPCVFSYLLFWWDWIIVILHSGVIGVFSKAYIAHKKESENNDEFKLYGPDFGRQKAAAILDCISGCLWLGTAIMSTSIFLKIRREKKQTFAEEL